MADPVSNTNPQAGNTPPNPEPGGTPAPRDMSQYIRTYAKDVAQLTNQPAPVIQPMPKPTPPTPADEGVTLPEVDESPVNHPDGVVKEFPQEEVALKKEDSTGIFSRLSDAFQPESKPKEAQFVPPVTQSLPADEQRRREEVLARLRAKVASHMTGSAPAPAAVPPAPAHVPPSPLPAQVYVPPPQPKPVPVPVPPPPPPAPVLPPPLPISSPLPAPAYSPFPPAPPQPAQPEIPTPAPMPTLGVVPRDTAGPSPFHSFSTDFANRIDQQQASTFSVLAAQSDEGLRTTTSVSTKKRGGLIPVILAVLLIIIGSGGLYAAYRFVSTSDVQEVTLGVPSLLLADEKMELAGPDYRQDLANAATQPLVEGNILITYVTVASSTSFGLKSAPQPGGALIRLLDLGAPDILLRNVDVSSTVGVVSAGGQTAPFFVMSVNSYERTFAGMLAWESHMFNDLADFYPEYIDPAPVATTTASTASSLVAPVSLSAPQGFTDGIVSNIDVRVLKDAGGRTLLMYGYSDKETLIIARDEAAFTTLVARLAATRGSQ